MWDRPTPRGDTVNILGMSSPAVIHRGGLVLFGNDGKKLNVEQLQFEDGKMIKASKYGKEDDASESLELTPEEKAIEATIVVSTLER
jgi:formyltetrahydrofolate dehydrogenase